VASRRRVVAMVSSWRRGFAAFAVKGGSAAAALRRVPLLRIVVWCFDANDMMRQYVVVVSTSSSSSLAMTYRRRGGCRGGLRRPARMQRLPKRFR